LFATGGVSYTWSPAAGLSNSNISNPVASPTSTTKYLVGVTGTNTCVSLDSLVITVKPKPVFAVNPQDPGVCLGDSLMLEASGGDTYQWSASDLASSSNTSSTWIKP